MCKAAELKRKAQLVNVYHFTIEEMEEFIYQVCKEQLQKCIDGVENYVKDVDIPLLNVVIHTIKATEKPDGL